MARQLGTEKFVGSEMGWRVGEEEQLNHASLVALRASPPLLSAYLSNNPFAKIVLHEEPLCWRFIPRLFNLAFPLMGSYSYYGSSKSDKCTFQ
ncbi:hypothetical protein CDAR_187161 [Caerostris darwini]|uniref:Uncharacterized protein n=1 Tax=Caerostris darwini TaxID=1538125 RepID=A0AAV4P214_9ARAC|nr:hypothetical protein CDAR_187161 [Caerostris darwini]